MKFLICILFILLIQLSKSQDSLAFNYFHKHYKDSMAYVKATENIFLYQNGKIVDTLNKEIKPCSFESAKVKIFKINKEWSTVTIERTPFCNYETESNQELNLNDTLIKELVQIKTKFLKTNINSLILYENPDQKSNKILDIVSTREEWWTFALLEIPILDLKDNFFKVSFKFEKVNYEGWVSCNSCCFTLFTSCE